MYVCNHIDNGSFVDPEGATGEYVDHSFAEGKCPLTYLCPISYDNLFSHTT
jgi:hypothetical protein